MLKTAEYNFSGFFFLESSEERHLSEIQIFCNIINVFIIILYQSLLNKSINFYNIYYIIIVPPSILSESLIITIILCLYFKIYMFILTYFNDSSIYWTKNCYFIFQNKQKIVQTLLKFFWTIIN